MLSSSCGVAVQMLATLPPALLAEAQALRDRAHRLSRDIGLRRPAARAMATSAGAVLLERVAINWLERWYDVTIDGMIATGRHLPARKLLVLPTN